MLSQLRKDRCELRMGEENQRRIEIYEEQIRRIKLRSHGPVNDDEVNGLDFYRRRRVSTRKEENHGKRCK